MRSVVEKAAYWYERIGPDFTPRANAGRPLDAEALLESWRDKVARGEEDTFDKRLAWDGMTREAAGSLLRGVELRAGIPLPPWAQCLSDVLAVCPRFAGEQRKDGPGADCIQPDSPFPFEDLVLPFTHWAIQSIQRFSPEGFALLRACHKIKFTIL